jgi:hypothetical protein
MPRGTTLICSECQQQYHCLDTLISDKKKKIKLAFFDCYICKELLRTPQRHQAQQERARIQRIEDEPRLHVIPSPELEAKIKVEEEGIEPANTNCVIYPFFGTIENNEFQIFSS